ncbi:methyl-accepting chemotaxis sensory transducer with Pas/Pac sensor [Psychromonas sp. CNPT3]|uniref:methyl-accepting chemotaxis protein n=1 Tax=Psychromonas sp. CNPT3 TaxID=314282 RepID=UPI00006E7904|nr:PAS domain-containing methyl-accepting chemotaxis protein [Psychromonas sp. CNPT3]AGH82072.1 methyl-accepting chemotaxis sensory transducer with Pas/Pac sensor [Psychromonas sp. CNPT3]
MQNNQPINTNEKHFKVGSTLVSVTNTNGVIEYINSDFEEISGFSKEELIGQNHNIVRHPDMPEAAFADLWGTIKTDGEWRGIVKNRCKDGSFYWVDAYVIPVYKNGQKVGYQSIRSIPTRAQIEGAEALYRTLNANKSLTIKHKVKWGDIDMSRKLSYLVSMTLMVMVALAIFYGLETNHSNNMLAEQLSILQNIPSLSAEQQNLQQYILSQNNDQLINFSLMAVVGALIITLWLLMLNSMIKPIIKIREQLRLIAGGDLTKIVDSTKTDEIGKATMAVKLLQARLRTIFGQFIETTEQLVASADNVSSSSLNMQQGMQKQTDDTNLVATAMNEMLASVEDVSNNAKTASKETERADEDSQSGAEVVNTAHTAMTKLSNEVKETASVINRLADESNKISTITDTISSIAEQTNLLALNAAIEAARAGEQGRGFAVVADEVRSLASRTQDATSEIRGMIDNLHSGISGAVEAMEDNIQQVSTALAEVETSKESFTRISSAIKEINTMNSHIATAAEEQRQVSQEMNQNILSINNQSNEATSEAVELQKNALKLNAMAVGLQEQLDTIDLGKVS